MKNKLMLMLGFVLLVFVVIVFAVAPNQPELNSPTNASINNTDAVNLSVIVTDDDGDVMNVSFYWYGGEGSYEWCYQESANVSTACGGLDTGSYNGNDWQNPDLVIDGNWGTHSNPKTFGKSYYFNYTIPFAVEAIWKTQSSFASYDIKNFTIPNACLTGDTLILKVTAISSSNSIWSCYNSSSAWFIVGSTTGGSSAHYITEEAMWWKISITNIANATNIANGSTATFEWTGLADGVYNWYSVVTDGVESNTSDVWTFTVDTEDPTIIPDSIGLNKTYIYENNLTAQINASDTNLYSVNVTFNGSAIFGITNLNQTLYVYNLNQNISTYPTGVYNITFRVCDGFTEELNCITETYEFYVYNYTITYITPVLETSSQTFTLNITRDSDFITDANATLHWNGTAYSATKTATDDYFLLSKILTMPSITGNSTNITFNWTYTLVGNTNETSRTSDYTQQIYNIDIDDCSTYSIVALNFSLIEESNNASIAGDMDFTFTLTAEDVSISYSKSVTSVNSTAFCIPTDEIGFTAQLQSEYTANSYDGFTYFAYNLVINNVTQYIYYYLTNGTTIVEFTVLDQNGDALKNAYIKIKKYDIGTGTYKTRKHNIRHCLV